MIIDYRSLLMLRKSIEWCHYIQYKVIPRAYKYGTSGSDFYYRPDLE